MFLLTVFKRFMDNIPVQGPPLSRSYSPSPSSSAEYVLHHSLWSHWPRSQRRRLKQAQESKSTCQILRWYCAMLLHNLLKSKVFFFPLFYLLKSAASLPSVTCGNSAIKTCSFFLHPTSLKRNAPRNASAESILYNWKLNITPNNFYKAKCSIDRIWSGEILEIMQKFILPPDPSSELDLCTGNLKPLTKINISLCIA